MFLASKKAFKHFSVFGLRFIDTRQNTARKSFSDRETIDVKVVVNHYENSHEIIIPRNCHMIDRSSNERSITMNRPSARKICKQSKINGHLHCRDREPSRIPVKKVIQITRKRKLRQKFKRIIRTTIPTSSKLFHSRTSYKLWYIYFIQKNLHSFYTAYFRSQSSHAHKNCWKNFKSKQYSASDIKLLLSGDIEMNPGPAENVINKSICFSPQDNSILLTTRLRKHRLKRPRDVGDCFFRSIKAKLSARFEFYSQTVALQRQSIKEFDKTI